MNKKKRSIFKNRPLVKALAFFAAGVVFSTVFQLDYLYSFIPFILSSVISIYFYYKADLKYAAVSVCVMLFFLGWFRADLAAGPFPPNHIENLAETGGTSVLYGRIVEEPDIREDRTYLVIETDSVSIRNYTIPSFGRVRAKVINGETRFDHSDYVAAKGFLYKPSGPRNPGGFDYAGYLRTRNIFVAMSVTGPHNVSIIERGTSFLSSVVTPARNYMINAARENLTPVSAAILSGFILGERRDIPEEYQTMFRDTGTLHLMAVSGSNVGLVLAVIAFPLTLIGMRRKPKVAILLLVVVFFAILTRLEASVVRASIMASVGLLAYGWLRKPDYVNLLGFAGLIMLFWRPLQLFDVGLQLSFAATFAIVYVVPDIYRRIKPITGRKLRWVRWIATALVTTIVAQAAVMPLMALYFNRFPLVGIIANLPVMLLASAASALGIALYVFSIVGGFIENILASVIEVIMDLVKINLELFMDLPFAVTRTPSFGWPLILLYWIALYMIYEFLFKRRFSAKGVVASLVCLNLLIWPGIFEEKPSWAVEFIDVGPSRAWIFTDGKGNNLGCFDIHHQDKYVENNIVSNILNFHGGRLEWLISATPDCEIIKSIRESFQPEIIKMNEINTGEKDEIDFDLNRRAPSAGIKFIWGQSDNTEREGLFPPCILVDTDRYYLMMAGRSDAQILQNRDFDKKIAILELPWSAYARTDCMKTIDRLNPICVAFSPDRFSTGAPRKRSELTHSSEKVLATSIHGGFRVAEINGDLRIESMESMEIEE